MLKDTVFAALISFAVCAAIMPFAVPALHKLKFGQFIRDAGPEEHKKKSGTPTMGGVVFITATVISSLFFMNRYPMIIPVVLFMFLFGVIGFLDDYLKIRKKNNEGLKVWQKLLMQIIVTGVFAGYLYVHPEIGSKVLIPFSPEGKTADLGILFLPFVFFVVLGTDNGVNFTDGLDGLCSSVTVIVAAFFAAFAIRKNLMIAPVAGSVAGALIAFLIWNVYPAKVFMGDTGSLALGGFVASFALMTRTPVFIAVVGIIYLCEVLSVMLQVSYFKLTHGKRIFKMSPIHHHFELCGWSETRVVCVFTIVTVLAVLITFIYV